ncbi:MAG: YidC/Oxa1 family membrane protein insertase [Clostridiaceae bacterium]|mgnify:FL=1|jgi:YidC/Oxa1 family membrane protein insertase|nr:YidC/Oxa1 family membrane protein insertase [Clostridiaceae bacterium]
MQALLSALGVIFGKLMFFIYNTVGFHNYAISLLLFTIVYKVILLPLSVKQIRSTQKMQEYQPELQRIQERYKNDKEKLNEMTMKFYQEKGYNPTSGCLPLLIQFPIIIALFYVIRMPMTYMLELPAKAVGEMVVASVEKGEFSKETLKNKNYDAIKDNPIDVYMGYNSSDPYFEIRLIESYKKHPEIIDENPTLNEEQKTLLKNFDLRMFNFFNLGVQPSLDPRTIKSDPGIYVPALLLLIIAVVTTYFSSLLMMPNARKKKDPKDKKSKDPNAGCAGKSMLYMSPLMTLWIGTIAPSGLAFYWIINSVLSYVQHKVLNIKYKNDKEEKEVAKVGNKGSKDSR